MLSRISYLLVFILLISGLISCSGKKASGHSLKDLPPGTQTLTLYGKLDPRLTANVINMYAPGNLEGDDNCSGKDTLTGGKRPNPGWMVAPIKPDAEGNYRVTIPFSYVGKFDCGFSFFKSSVRIKRHPDDELYANIMLASALAGKVIHTCQGTRSGETSCPKQVVLNKPKLAHKYFQLATGSKVACHTQYLVRVNRAYFICEPYYSAHEHSVDAFTTAEIQLDIVVDEAKSFYIYPYDKQQKKPSKPKQAGIFTEYDPDNPY